MDIRREYSALLSIGKSNEVAEAALIAYYSSILNRNDPDEEVFWFTLSFCEWKKGRLSPFVKEKALLALQSGLDLERWRSAGNEKEYKRRIKVLDNLKETILSPMPPAKKIKKPTVHHCPWKVGSLLAYRIVSAERMNDHPLFMKYVLLRVVKIKKHPVSKLFKAEYYDESMMVALYNWIGSKIPDPEIVNQLEYTFISENSLVPPKNPIDYSSLDQLPEESRETLKKGILTMFEKQITKCVWFDWLPYGNVHGDITFLNCDENFENSIPDFFKPNFSSSTYTHFIPFDYSLRNRFEPYLNGKSDFDYLII